MSRKNIAQLVDTSVEEAPAIVARAQKRSADKKRKATKAAKSHRATPAHKRAHGVDNDTLVANTSARQTDVVDDIDRDSEVPTAWRRQSLLEAPDPRPGYVQKWIRFKSGKDEDTDNLQKALDSGWSPRKRTTAKRGHELTADTNAKYGQYIVKRGLILCEMPEKMADQRNAFYANKTKRMTESIDRSLFKENNRIMPVLRPEISSQTTRRARRGRLEDAIAGDD
jgi:hypothetical protein